MHIKELRVFGFKRFREASISFSEGINIVVGDNDSGKSTLLEAVTAVIDGQYRGAPLMRSISEDLFNKDIVDEYLCLLKNGKPCNPPSRPHPGRRGKPHAHPRQPDGGGQLAAAAPRL